jgi:zinc transport system substrate-binding protein
MKARSMLLSILYLLLLTHSASAMDVFVSIAPQKWLADNLGGGLITTHVLISEGREPHTFEPTPKQMAKLSKASLYFTVDMEFEHQLVRRLASNINNLKFVNSAQHVTKIPIITDDHHDHSGHAKHNESLDPHIWLSPLNLKIMAKEMAEAMIDADSENEARYRENLALFTKKLDALDQRIGQQLAPFAGRTFYVFHPSFGYFAHDYKLHQKAVEVAGKSPSPKQLSQLIAQAKKDNVKIIFVQPQFDTKSGEAIARAIEGEVVPLDPLAEDVAENLEVMMQKIKSALSK